MEIIEFVQESKENPYTGEVEKLIARLDEIEKENAETGGNKMVTAAGRFEWPSSEFNKERVLFSKAANDAGKTARLRVKEETIDEAGNKVIKATFTLTHKHAKRRDKEKEDAKKAAEANGEDNGTAAPFVGAPDNDTPPDVSNDAAEATPESTPEADSNDGSEEVAETVEQAPTVSNRRRR